MKKLNKPIKSNGGGSFNGNSPDDCLKAGAVKGLSSNFRFSSITVDMPSGLQTPCLQQERRNNMEWQPQTYSNGTPTGRMFTDVDSETTRLRIYKKADGKLWCMFYPNKANLEHCYQPWFGKIIGETVMPSHEQWAAFNNLLKTA